MKTRENTTAGKREKDTMKQYTETQSRNGQVRMAAAERTKETDTGKPDGYFFCSKKDCFPISAIIVPGDTTSTMQVYLESFGWDGSPFGADGPEFTCPDCVRAALLKKEATRKARNARAKQARKQKASLMDSLGLARVKGNLGGTYWE